MYFLTSVTEVRIKKVGVSTGFSDKPGNKISLGSYGKIYLYFSKLGMFIVKLKKKKYRVELINWDKSDHYL